MFYEVYNELGRGFLESEYENAMGIDLKEAGLSALEQAPVTVRFRGRMVGDFRADLLVQNAAIVELKAAKAIEGAHEAQFLNYLNETEVEVGLLMMFGPNPEFKRFVFDNERKAGAPWIDTEKHR